MRYKNNSSKSKRKKSNKRVRIRNKINMKEWGLLSLWWNLKKHTKFEACNFVTYKEVNPPNKKK